MRFVRALICVTAIAMIGAAGTGYHGDYRVEYLEIQYDVPASLVAPPPDTHSSDAFSSERDLGIFWSYFPKKNWWKVVPGGGGLSLGLSPFPEGMKAKHDLTAYAEFYEHHGAERGLRAQVKVETISGIDWARIEESYKNGNLARVIYVTPILPNYQLVCRIGLIDDLDHEAKTSRWSEWLPAMAEVMKSIRFVDTKTGAQPKGLGLSHP